MPNVGAHFTGISGKDGELLKVTKTGYLAVSTENLEFFDTIDGANINTLLWNQSTSTMTITQANSQVNVNATASTTASAYAIASTIQNFFMTSTNPLYARMSVQSTLWNLPANTTLEFGWGTCATTSAPTDGVFIRAAAGQTQLVLNNNGTEYATTFTLPAINASTEFWMHVYGASAKLYVDNVLVCDVAAPATWPAITNNNRQPLFYRVYNGGGAPASSPVLKLGAVSVQNINAEFCKSFSDKLIGMGRSSVQAQVNPFGALANHANSAAPSSATLSNTTAGYTTPGGDYQFAAVAGAETDYALFAYQIPAGFQFYVDAIRVSCYNMGAAVATTPTLLQWMVGINSSNVSLATTDGAGTWAPRTIGMGVQSLPVAAAIGYAAQDIVWTPLANCVVDGGRFLHVILKMPVGTATGSQVIRGNVAILGWFE